MTSLDAPAGGMVMPAWKLRQIAKQRQMDEETEKNMSASVAPDPYLRNDTGQPVSDVTLGVTQPQSTTAGPTVDPVAFAALMQQLGIPDNVAATFDDEKKHIMIEQAKLMPPAGPAPAVGQDASRKKSRKGSSRKKGTSVEQVSNGGDDQQDGAHSDEKVRRGSKMKGWLRRRSTSSQRKKDTPVSTRQGRSLASLAEDGGSMNEQGAQNRNRSTTMLEDDDEDEPDPELPSGLTAAVNASAAAAVTVDQNEKEHMRASETAEHDGSLGDGADGNSSNHLACDNKGEEIDDNDDDDNNDDNNDDNDDDDDDEDNGGDGDGDDRLTVPPTVARLVSSSDEESDPAAAPVDQDRIDQPTDNAAAARRSIVLDDLCDEEDTVFGLPGSARSIPSLAITTASITTIMSALPEPKPGMVTAPTSPPSSCSSSPSASPGSPSPPASQVPPLSHAPSPSPPRSPPEPEPAQPPPEKGRREMGGNDKEPVALNTARRKISWAPQDVLAFDGRTPRQSNPDPNPPADTLAEVEEKTAVEETDTHMQEMKEQRVRAVQLEEDLHKTEMMSEERLESVKMAQAAQAAAAEAQRELEQIRAEKGKQEEAIAEVVHQISTGQLKETDHDRFVRETNDRIAMLAITRKLMVAEEESFRATAKAEGQMLQIQQDQSRQEQISLGELGIVPTRAARPNMETAIPAPESHATVLPPTVPKAVAQAAVDDEGGTPGLPWPTHQVGVSIEVEEVPEHENEGDGGEQDWEVGRQVGDGEVEGEGRALVAVRREDGDGIMHGGNRDGDHEGLTREDYEGLTQEEIEEIERYEYLKKGVGKGGGRRTRADYPDRPDENDRAAGTQQELMEEEREKHRYLRKGVGIAGGQHVKPRRSLMASNPHIERNTWVSKPHLLVNSNSKAMLASPRPSRSPRAPSPNTAGRPTSPAPARAGQGSFSARAQRATSARKASLARPRSPAATRSPTHSRSPRRGGGSFGQTGQSASGRKASIHRSTGGGRSPGRASVSGETAMTGRRKVADTVSGWAEPVDWAWDAAATCVDDLGSSDNTLFLLRLVNKGEPQWAAAASERLEALVQAGAAGPDAPDSFEAGELCCRLMMNYRAESRITRLSALLLCSFACGADGQGQAMGMLQSTAFVKSTRHVLRGFGTAETACAMCRTLYAVTAVYSQQSNQEDGQPRAQLGTFMEEVVPTLCHAIRAHVTHPALVEPATGALAFLSSGDKQSRSRMLDGTGLLEAAMAVLCSTECTFRSRGNMMSLLQSLSSLKRNALVLLSQPGLVTEIERAITYDAGGDANDGPSMQQSALSCLNWLLAFNNANHDMGPEATCPATATLLTSHPDLVPELLRVAAGASGEGTTPAPAAAADVAASVLNHAAAAPGNVAVTMVNQYGAQDTLRAILCKERYEPTASVVLNKSTSILHHLATAPENRVRMGEDLQLIEALVGIVHQHGGSKAGENSMGCLCALTLVGADPPDGLYQRFVTVGAIGIVTQLLSAPTAAPWKAKEREHAAMCAVGLSSTEEGRKHLVERSTMVGAILKAMSTCQDNRALTDAACWALHNLASHEPNKAAMQGAGVVEALQTTISSSTTPGGTSHAQGTIDLLRG